MSLDLKRQLITQLIESSRLLRNYIEHRAKSRGTTRAQWIVLFRLRQQEGLSQVDLAEVMELQPISLVRLLDRLVDQGLLERRPHPTDRRANQLYLTETDAGSSMISTACAILSQPKGCAARPPPRFRPRSPCFSRLRITSRTIRTPQSIRPRLHPLRHGECGDRSRTSPADQRGLARRGM